jgi:hypothetical protein
MNIDPKELKARYEDYARKMDLFMKGPTTTYFQQLVDDGIPLPDPELVSDAEIRTKLWEVIAGLEKRRVFLEHTNHLNDRELYSTLWRDTLREETPAIDKLGFRTQMDLTRLDGDDAETLLYLKYYADEQDRNGWLGELCPPDKMPPHEDPPFTRDDLLPGPPETVAEASAWLRAHWSEHAFATNRFGTTARAIEFVDQLYAAGASSVCVDRVMMLAHHGWAPYADTLLVWLPDDPTKRPALFDLMNDIGKRDENGGDHAVLIDSGQKDVRLWWD